MSEPGTSAAPGSEGSRAPRRRRRLIPILVLAGGAGLVLLLRATLLAPEPLVVRVARVERGTVEATVTNSKAGTVRARRRARLSPETGGAVLEIARREGERARAGEVLIRLNDASQRAAVDLARRSLEVAEAALRKGCLESDQARRELERNRRLVRGDIVSEDAIEKLESASAVAVSACQAASAEVEKARAALVAAEAEVRKTEIRAPFDGVVAELSVELGEWITPAPPLVPVPGIVDLLDPSSLFVSAPMDEVDAAVLAVGQRARVAVDPLPGRSYGGTVVRVAPYILDVEAQNRTVEVEVDFDDPAAAKIPPGASADVEIVLEVRTDAVRVPAAALLEGERTLLLSGGRLVERPVRLGIRNWEFAEVLEGLAPGEEVVVSLDRVEVRAGARAVVERKGGP